MTSPSPSLRRRSTAAKYSGRSAPSASLLGTRPCATAARKPGTSSGGSTLSSPAATGPAPCSTVPHTSIRRAAELEDVPAFLDEGVLSVAADPVAAADGDHGEHDRDHGHDGRADGAPDGQPVPSVPDGAYRDRKMERWREEHA